ncbi:molybdenum cofactor cytidylyltransferase [Algibacter lectus]|uniref:nucleotidyltransferase family protein n=1 Tax=Algibacter lectus TaxID=221126 RepID=UPI0008EF8F03|nr:nucleotidyltransferase family protein [Algibacter lectus]SFC45251.1 molybdenum cofactor cytidylyltransferase [Algibacter lectus]
MKKENQNIVTVVLAAGASTRMRSPKQLLNWGNSTLLEHTLNTVLELNSSEVVVVLGANFEIIQSEIYKYPVTVLNNISWKVGLGKSIAVAVEYIQKLNYKVDGVMIVLADQPLIDSRFLGELCNAFNPNNNQIITTSYKNGKRGVPVIFDKYYFEELMLLNDDDGAKTLLETYANSVNSLKPQFENLDIDSKEDYNYLHKEIFKK